MSTSPRLTPVVVLELHGTGFATAVCLADRGVDVRGVSFDPAEAGRRSRSFQVLALDDLRGDEDRICRCLADYAATLPDRPVVLPTSDALALMVARERAALEPVCRIWSTSYDDLLTVVSKERLYAVARRAGVPIPPMLVSPRASELAAWCAEHRAPYLVKPYYNGVSGCAMRGKNQTFASADELVEYMDGTDPARMIVQRMVRGGDGWVFDTYGLCDRDGRVVTLASHRRIRQYPPDRGSTCMGEIPASPPGAGQEVLFERTRRLLGALRFHGIFGIEWLYDRDTGELLLLDFNARPFSTIGHLDDSGLNLPLLAYDELLGADLGHVAPYPVLRHTYWVDFLRDFRTFNNLHASGEIAWSDWLSSVSRCRSFAYFRWRDPGPGLVRMRELVRVSARFLGKRLGK